MKKLEKYLCALTLTAVVWLAFAPIFSVSAQTAAKIVAVKSDGNKIACRPTQPRRRAKKMARQNMTQKNFTAVAEGDWGAAGIRLTVDEKGAHIEYDCASGEITDKLMFDDSGNFAAAGTHTRLAPGPIRVGFEPQAQPARYEGKISGKTMMLKVVLTENNATVGEYNLEQGKTPRLHRCL